MDARKRSRNRLRSTVKAQAYSLLSSLSEAPGKPVTIVARDGDIRVIVTVAPEGVPVDAGAAPEGVKGIFLSPIEAAIVNALKAAMGAALSGKVIAARVSQEYDTRLKYLLVNLEERQIIEHEHGAGYRIAGSSSRA